MNETLPNRMRDATRLTREGRLMEATALLQQTWRSKVPTDTSTMPPQRTVPQSRIIDVDPETGDALDPATAPTEPRSGMGGHAAATGSGTRFAALMPKALRGAKRATATLPDGAAFVTRTFANDAGSLDYKLYIPAGGRGAAMPLVVMLHGCTQSPDDFAAGTRMNLLAEEHGCVIAYPWQTHAANAQKCWNWFSPADQGRDRGEPALIAGITHQVLRDQAVDPRRIYVAGLSAGGAAAAIMGMAYPDLYAAIGVHSGLACGAARDIPSAFTAMRQGATSVREPGSGEGRRRVPAIVFHADEDTTVHPRNGDQVIAQSGASGSLRIETLRGEVPGGHAYSRTTHRDDAGRSVLEQWVVHGGGHAWSGGSSAGSYTDPRGPDASREMLRFFLGHALGHDPD